MLAVKTVRHLPTASKNRVTKNMGRRPILKHTYRSVYLLVGNARHSSSPVARDEIFHCTLVQTVEALRRCTTPYNYRVSTENMTTYRPVLFTAFMANIYNIIYLSDQLCENEYGIQRFGHYFYVQSQVVDVMIDPSIPSFAFMSQNPDFKMYTPM